VKPTGKNSEESWKFSTLLYGRSVFKLQSSNLTTALEAAGLEIRASKNCQMAPVFANAKDSSVARLEGAGLEMHFIVINWAIPCGASEFVPRGEDLRKGSSCD
jgi:hypothetical protein